MMSMKMHTSLPLILLLGASMLPERANAQTDPNSSGAPSPPTVDSHAPAWLFPSNFHPGGHGRGFSKNPAHDEGVRRRAYEIYREGGEQPGCELDDWLQAERELERGMLRRAQAE